MTLLKFSLALVVVACGLGSFAWAGSAAGLFPLPSFFLATLFLLLLLTGLSFTLLYKSGSPSNFLRMYLISTTLKLMVYAAYNLVVIFQDRATASANVLFFMIAYFIFTVMETGLLYRTISRRSKR